MTKNTAIIFLGVLVAVLPALGFPSWVRTIFFVFLGLGIALLAYLSSVVYCSNCEKLIEEADRALDEQGGDQNTTTI